jgi:high-affinity Fe2+/Pb2+ permease
MGGMLISLILGLAIALLTISIAWITYRPLIGGGLLAGVVALFWFIKKRHVQTSNRISSRTADGTTNTTSGPPPVPPPPPA